MCKHSCFRAVETRKRVLYVLSFLAHAASPSQLPTYPLKRQLEIVSLSEVLRSHNNNRTKSEEYCACFGTTSTKLMLALNALKQKAPVYHTHHSIDIRMPGNIHRYSNGLGHLIPSGWSTDGSGGVFRQEDAARERSPHSDIERPALSTWCLFNFISGERRDNLIG